MASGSLLALLDDIASVLDDVTLMTKVAAKKTAGVLGDDLALNAEQVNGVRAERELPVVWAVFKGSLINKVILVPAALLISAIAPWLVVYLLMLGGLYLCFEGMEKIWHSLMHHKAKPHSKAQLQHALHTPSVDLTLLEKDKIRGAIRTDFVLSAEIIVIALGSVGDAAFISQVITVSLIAAIMTFGVYGFVALIVKLDDMALALLKDPSAHSFAKIKRVLGQGLLHFCPILMKLLSIVGTAAMFLVGGGILVHGIPFLHHLPEHWHLPLPALAAIIINLLTGVIAGTVLLVVVTTIQRARRIKVIP